MIKHKIPLPIAEERCLGHFQTRSGCPHINTCARHLTISAQDEQWDVTQPPFFSACSTEEFEKYLEISK